MLETEYQRAVLVAEAWWVTEIIGELRSGELAWSREELLAFAEGSDAAAGTAGGRRPA
jgi:hypothetical protein